MKKKPIDIDALVAEAVPMRENPQLAFTMPVRTVSEANEREHWRRRHNRKKEQQEDTHKAWKKAKGDRPLFLSLLPSCHVRLVRVGPRRLDTDNLAGSFKHVQDAIAIELGVDDGDSWVKWEYEQVAVGKRVYSVRVEVY